MVRISPHLTFNGQCRDAFVRYQAVFGGTLTTLLTYGESPTAKQIDVRWHHLIMHATLALGPMELMGADQTPDSYNAPHGVYMVATLPTLDKARAVFDGLAADGQITLPFEPTFWSPGFGMLVDAFGISWEVNTNTPAA